MYQTKSYFGRVVLVVLLLFFVCMIAAQTRAVSAQGVGSGCPTQSIIYTVLGPYGHLLQISTIIPAGSTLPKSPPPIYAMVSIQGIGSVPVTSPPGTPGGLPIAYVPGEGYVVLGGTLTPLGQQYLAQLTSSPAYTIIHTAPIYGSVIVPGIGTVPILNSPGPIATPWTSSPTIYGTVQINSGVGCGKTG